MIKTDLISKMEKELNFNIIYKGCFTYDLVWLSVGGFGCDDYIWVVMDEFTDLIPLHLALAEGSFENDKANTFARKTVKTYLIKVTSRENGTVDGIMTEVKDLKRYLYDNEKTPISVTMECELNGKIEEVTIDWNPDYYNIIKDRIRVSPSFDDIWNAYVKAINY